MQAHFSNFTPDAMRGLGQELAADFQRRREFIADTKQKTSVFLADARKVLGEVETERRKGAEQQADGRRLFMSELRAGVHALRSKFEISRRGMVEDLQEMAGELRAASAAFRARPGAKGGFFFRQSDQPVTHFFSKEGDHESGAAKPAGHSKKRHG